MSFLMSVPLRSERSRGLAGMQRDTAPVEWPRSEGGDPTEGSMLGQLLWKPTPNRRAESEEDSKQRKGQERGA